MTAQQSGREAFEAWYAANDNTRKSIERDATGYRLIQTEAAWQAWDAAWQAALAQQGREVAVEGIVNERGEPDVIWLQVHGDANPADYDEPADMRPDGVTWCWEPIFEHDVMYVRADLAAPKQQAVDVDAIRADAELILSELDAVTAYTDDASDHIGCAEIAATRIIAALAGKTEVDRG